MGDSRKGVYWDYNQPQAVQSIQTFSIVPILFFWVKWTYCAHTLYLPPVFSPVIVLVVDLLLGSSGRSSRNTKFKPFRQHKQVSRGKKNKKLDSNLLLLSCFLPLTPTIPLATGLHILNGEFKKRRRRRRKQRGLNLNFYFFLRGHSNKYCDLIGS